jgi:hypothetical protein
MTTNSETILTVTSHPGGGPTTVVGEQYKGDGYYGRSDGLHTIQYSLAAFSGTISIQATLAVDPVNSDWFTVYTQVHSVENTSVITNFTGNYVWIRAVVTYTNGAINSILLNH